MTDLERSLLLEVINDADDYGRSSYDTSVAHEVGDDHFIVWIVDEDEGAESEFKNGTRHVLRHAGYFGGHPMVSLASERLQYDGTVLSAHGTRVFAMLYA